MKLQKFGPKLTNLDELIKDNGDLGNTHFPVRTEHHISLFTPLFENYTNYDLN